MISVGTDFIIIVHNISAITARTLPIRSASTAGDSMLGTIVVALYVTGTRVMCETRGDKVEAV